MVSAYEDTNKMPTRKEYTPSQKSGEGCKVWKRLTEATIIVAGMMAFGFRNVARAEKLLNWTKYEEQVCPESRQPKWGD